MGMTADVEGLHIDDYDGTAGTEYLGACFCPHCTKAFAEFLRTKVSPQRLKECGVTSPDGFDYGAYLKGRGFTKIADFNRVIFGSPVNLGPEYLRFQYSRAAEFVGDVRKYAEQIVGHPLLLSVNAGVSDPKNLFVAPYVSYFCGEVNHGTEELAWGPKRIATLSRCGRSNWPMRSAAFRPAPDRAATGRTSTPRRSRASCGCGSRRTTPSATR